MKAERAEKILVMIRYGFVAINAVGRSVDLLGIYTVSTASRHYAAASGFNTALCNISPAGTRESERVK
jgi:hypothetical protein